MQVTRREKNKSYRALFQQELLEHQVHSASIQESTEMESKTANNLSAHTNADILDSQENIF